MIKAATLGARLLQDSGVVVPTIGGATGQDLRIGTSIQVDRAHLHF